MYRELSYLMLAGLALTAVKGVDAQEVGKGNVLFEYWSWGGINGNIETLKSHPDFPDRPTVSEWWRSMSREDMPYTNFFGACARGYLTPPQTGDYTFWIYSDDDGELWLSTDSDPASKTLVANVDGWTNPNEWDKSPSQKSKAPISLEAGKRYYIEALYSDGIGAGLVGVGWTGPGIGDVTVVIDGKYLSPFIRTPEPLCKARNPVPSSGAMDVIIPLLQWTAGNAAVWHDIYLGTTPDLGPGDLRLRVPVSMTMYFPPQPFTPGITYYWRVDEVDATGNTHMGNVWSFTIVPPMAWQPSPSDADSIYLGTDSKVLLAWAAGSGAVRHRVYFGDDPADVAAGTGGTNRGEQAATSFMTGPLAPGTTYYWRVDEVLMDNTTSPGVVWSFRAVEMLFFEGFEGYSDASFPWTGMGVGHDMVVPGTTTMMETKVTFSGGQSMPLRYSLSHGAEASYDFAPPQDWTGNGMKTADIVLSLYIYGRPDNQLARLFVAITDASKHTAVVEHWDPSVVRTASWQKWDIPLSSFTGVNMGKVKQISIGVRATKGFSLTYGNLHAASASGDPVILCDNVAVNEGEAGPTTVVLDGYLRSLLTGDKITSHHNGTVTFDPGGMSGCADDEGYYCVESFRQTYNVSVKANGFVDAPVCQMTRCCDARRDFLLQPIAPKPPSSCAVYSFGPPDGPRSFFTTSEPERSNLLSYTNDWTYAGIAFCAVCDGGGLEVHRFWNALAKTHFYTLSEGEMQNLITNFAAVWLHEGPAFRAHEPNNKPAGTKPVYRFWSSSLVRHFYTMCENEKNAMDTGVWSLEGVAWNAFDCAGGYTCVGNGN